MIKIDVLDNGTKILISDKEFKTLYFTPDGEENPTKFGIVLTEEIMDAITQGFEWLLD